MIKKILKKIILYLIELIEKIQYRNLDLDENNISKKIIKSIKLSYIQVLTDTGYEELQYLHNTQPYKVWTIITESGKILEGADLHKVYDKNYNKISFDKLELNTEIITVDGLEKIISISKSNNKIGMFDVTVNHPNHRLYTNGILSSQTICSSIYIAWYVLFNFDKNCLILSNKGATTREIVDKAKVILDNLPFFMKPGLLKNDVFNLKFDNGCRIVAQSTTKKAGIGFTIHLLFLDEFAHIHPNFVHSFYENVFPTLSSSQISRIIITSTPNGFNKFHDIYDGAVRKQNEFKDFRVDWWEVPGRDNEWMRKEISNLGGEDAFNRQYGNQFISGDNLLLGPGELKKLENAKVEFISHQFDELEDLEIPYEIFLKWHPKFDIDEIGNEENYWLFSCDLSAGNFGDHAVINIFKLELLDKDMFKHLKQPGSFMDFFALKQIGVFRSNEHSPEQYAKILYTLIFDIFYAENIKIIIEWNTFGGELIKNLQTIFPSRNEFDEEMIVKFKHRNDAKTPSFGLRIKTDNKPIICQKFKKSIRENRIQLFEFNTIEEAKQFGKTPAGSYAGMKGHDDLIMSCITSNEFFSTMDFSDFAEELYEIIEKDIQDLVDKELNKGSKGEDGSLFFDIYDII